MPVRKATIAAIIAFIVQILSAQKYSYRSIGIVVGA